MSKDGKLKNDIIWNKKHNNYIKWMKPLSNKEEPKN
jgi:hypothetical protein